MVPDKMHFRELLNKYYVTYAIKEAHVVIKNIKVTENAFYLPPSAPRPSFPSEKKPLLSGKIWDGNACRR